MCTMALPVPWPIVTRPKGVREYFGILFVMLWITRMYIIGDIRYSCTLLYMGPPKKAM